MEGIGKCDNLVGFDEGWSRGRVVEIEGWDDFLMEALEVRSGRESRNPIGRSTRFEGGQRMDLT